MGETVQEIRAWHALYEQQNPGAATSGQPVHVLLAEIERLEAIQLCFLDAETELAEASARQENIIGIQLRLTDDLRAKLKLAEAVCETMKRRDALALDAPETKQREVDLAFADAYDAYLAGKGD